MFHIVGTNHDLQHDGQPCETSRREADKWRDRLRSHLLNLAGDIVAQATGPVIIAEELSEFYLRHKKAASVAQSVATELCICHRFCDPDPETRIALGLPLRTDDSYAPDLLRECYWLTCLLDVAKRDVLFVCGAAHVRSFSGLLRNRGIPVKVRAKYFGRCIFMTASTAKDAVS